MPKKRIAFLFACLFDCFFVCKLTQEGDGQIVYEVTA